jgi:hypothetical protein
MSAQPIPERTNFRSWLADNWKALLTVWVISLLPFLPVLFAGEILFSSDQMGAPGWRWYFDALRGGELPLWNPHLVGGMPTFDAMVGDATYPPFVLLGFLLPVAYVVTVNFILHVLLAGFNAYLLTQRYFRLERWLAVPLALAWALNPHFISYIFGGHTGKFHIMAWLPLSLYFLLRVLGPSASWRHFLGLSLTVAAFIFTTHLQFTYFVMMGYFLVWLYFLIPAVAGRHLRRAGSLVLRFWIPLLLGVGLTFFFFYPPLKYNKDFSVRGGAERTTFEHATSWSMHPEETASLLVPEFGGLNEKYWGRNPFKLNTEAPGTTVWFLALLGLFAFRKHRWYWLWGGVGLLAMLYGLAAHTPVFRIFYEFVPGIKNFRAASMMLFWLSMALVLMSAETVRRLTTFGPEALTDAQRGAILRKLRLWGWSIAGLLVVCGLVPGLPYALWGWFVDESAIPNIVRQPAAEGAFALGAFRVAALVALLTWGVSSFLLRTRRLAAFGITVLVAVVVDAYWVNTHFIRGYNADALTPDDPAIAYIQSDTDRFRVMSIPGALERWHGQYYGFELADGWVDNELRHFREYRGHDYHRNPTFFENLQQNSDGTVSGSKFLDMLNVKYIAFRTQDSPGLNLVLNSSMLPRAWFVPAWEEVSESRTVERMLQDDFDPRRIAFVAGEGGRAEGAAPAEGAPVVAAEESVRRYNYQSYTVDAPSRGVLVVSDVWFPHWKAQVDGEDVPLLRVNHVFRGVMLEPGSHRIDFVYRSPWIALGLRVSIASLLALVVLCFLWWRFGVVPGNSPARH